MVANKEIKTLEELGAEAGAMFLALEEEAEELEEEAVLEAVPEVLLTLEVTVVEEPEETELGFSLAVPEAVP